MPGAVGGDNAACAYRHVVTTMVSALVLGTGLVLGAQAVAAAGTCGALWKDIDFNEYASHSRTLPVAAAACTTGAHATCVTAEQ